MSCEAGREVVSGNADEGGQPIAGALLVGHDCSQLWISGSLCSVCSRSRPTPFDHIHRTSLVGRFSMSDGPDYGELVEIGGDQWQLLTDSNSGKPGGDRLELTPNVAGREWFGIERIVVRDASLQPDENDRLGSTVYSAEGLTLQRRRQCQPQSTQQTSLNEIATADLRSCLEVVATGLALRHGGERG